MQVLGFVHDSNVINNSEACQWPNDMHFCIASVWYSVYHSDSDCLNCTLLWRFLHELEMAYAASDVVISRAGAMTCTEILATGKPSILVWLIPWSYFYSFQFPNSMFFARLRLIGSYEDVILLVLNGIVRLCTYQEKEVVLWTIAMVRSANYMFLLW